MYVNLMGNKAGEWERGEILIALINDVSFGPGHSRRVTCASSRARSLTEELPFLYLSLISARRS